MTPRSSAVEERIRVHVRREYENQCAIVACARGLVSVLKDRGADASAEELQALLFVHDAELQDIHRYIASLEPVDIAELLPELLGRAVRRAEA